MDTMKKVIVKAGQTVFGVTYLEPTPMLYSDNFADHLVASGQADWTQRFHRDQAVKATREIRFAHFAIPAGTLGHVQSFADGQAGPFHVRFILPRRFEAGANVQLTVDVACDEIEEF